MAKTNKGTNKTTSKRASKKTGIDEIQFGKTPIDNSEEIFGGGQNASEIQLEITNAVDVNPTSQYNRTDSDDKTNAFDIIQNIYIEIHRGNIFHYFAAGLITPSKYIANRAFPDIQSVNEDVLVIANSHSSSHSEEVVLLEIALDPKEKQSLSVYENFACLSSPVPVSRIKGVHVRNEEIKNSIVSDALIFNGGFIPESLIKVGFPTNDQHFNFDNIQQIKTENYASRIEKFDRILGLLGFLRNYNLLLAEKTNTYKTLPNHFFYALQAIDSSFGTEIIPNNIISEFYSYLFNDTCPNEKILLNWIFSRVHMPDNFNDTDTKNFAELYIATANESEVESDIRRIFTSLSKNLERKSALEKIDSLKSKSALPLYVFAFLRNYANLNSIEISRRDISLVYSANFGEYAFALLGYFFGYKNLRNTDERTSSSNSILNQFNIIPTKPPIKFQLTTKFDYLIFELVYRNVFLGESGHFDISKLEMSNIKEESLSTPKGENSNYKITEALLYGKLYQIIYPSDPLAEFIVVLNKLPNDIPFLSEFGWYCYRLGVRMKPFSITDFFSSPMSLLKLVGYAKEDLMQFIETNRNKIDIEELKSRINLSQKHKEI